jgi:hypothetical protein
MAASVTELRRIYGNLFVETHYPGRLHALRAALDKVDRRQPDSRDYADRLLGTLNGGSDPGLSLTQLECLRSLLNARPFAALVPSEASPSDEASHQLRTFYRRLFSEPDLGRLRALQRAVFEYDERGTDDKRLAVLEMLREINPDAKWNDAHVGALNALLVRDIRFKQVAPFQVTGDWW